MSSGSTRIGAAVAALCIGLLATSLAGSQASTSPPQEPTNDRTRIVLSRLLPRLDGEHLRATLVEVRYGPGEASSPHSHACAVMAYVVEGAIRTQVKGEAEMIYRAGQSFYEGPNGVHLVSANASSGKPAKFVAYLICDRDAPLSADPSNGARPEGASQ